MGLEQVTRWRASDGTEHRTEAAGLAHEVMLADMQAHVAASGYEARYQPRIFEILRTWAVTRGVDPARLGLRQQKLPIDDQPLAQPGTENEETP